MMEKEKWIAFARYCGAEARANQRKTFTASDRQDIAEQHPAKTWQAMPEKDRDIAYTAFLEGYEAERATE